MGTESLLTAAGLRLRALEPDDADILYIWENDSSLWPYGNTMAPVSLNQLRTYIRNYTGTPLADGELRMMIEDCESGRPLGCVDLTDIDARDLHARVGIFVAVKERHQGVASVALRLIINYARTYLNLHQLIALVGTDNEYSHALFRRTGFKSCGNLRSYVRQGKHYSDVLIYQKLF
ncbi:MAG: GNAT family N-acetyltransferase [Muribaculaceae bacterium]|nr:GNAT family N-acetyltransferase [Muribaculaceae bacterium]